MHINKKSIRFEPNNDNMKTLFTDHSRNKALESIFSRISDLPIYWDESLNKWTLKTNLGTFRFKTHLEAETFYNKNK